MIDVPIAVRDALKDGGYKKNYRFIVGHTANAPAYETVATLTRDVPFEITETGDFRYYSPTGNEFEIEHDDGGISVTETIYLIDEDPTGGYYATVQFSVGDVGNTITNVGGSGILYLQKKTQDNTEYFIEDFILNNDQLVKESVKIDERMCSDDNLRFGLCEGSNLEFQAFNVENLTGKRIQAFVDVEYPVVTYDEELTPESRVETINTYPIPMGWYDVSETSRQASTGIRKVSAYNKLKSEYLDADATILIKEYFGNRTIRVIDILRLLLSNYGIRTEEGEYLPFNEWDFASKPKGNFRPYKYSSIYGDQGAFSPFVYTVSTSSSFYMEGYARYNGVSVNEGSVVRVEIDSLVETIDTAIATFLQNQFTRIQSSTTPAEIWNRLQNMKGVSTMGAYQLNGYFFYVEVTYAYDPFTRTYPVERYGNQLPNATGTFEDLRRRTLTNVVDIGIYTPIAVFYGAKLNSRGGVDYQYYQSYPDVYPYIRVNVTGANKEYKYRVDRDTIRTGTYTTPKMPDNSDIPTDLSQFFKVKVITQGVSNIELQTINPEDMANVTLRDIQTAVFEVNCQFGKLDRLNNFFTGIELNNERLYPYDIQGEGLYPDDGLYPMGTSDGGFKAMYSKLWADEGNVRSWRNLIITYKGLIEDPDTQEVKDGDKIYQVTIEADGTDDYEIKNNWLFKNLLWADSDTEDLPEAAGLENIENYAAAMVAKMRSVRWFPFEMWCAGLPYIETGDEVEIHVGTEAHRSYVLRRTLKGIQNLQDEMINGTLDIF